MKMPDDMNRLAARILASRVLRCHRCPRTFQPSQRQLAGYLQRGWPTCCGYTMDLVKAGGK